MSTIKANTLLHSDGSTTTQPSIPALDKRMAFSWCTISDCATTPAIVASYNVSSLTDVAVGRYDVNFTSDGLGQTPTFVVGGQNRQYYDEIFFTSVTSSNLTKVVLNCSRVSTGSGWHDPHHMSVIAFN